MDTQSVTADPKRYTDGESGAVGGLDPIDRVNRIHYMLDGLGGLQTIFDSAIHTPDEHQSTPLVWAPVLYMTGIILADIHHEVSALHDQMRAGET